MIRKRKAYRNVKGIKENGTDWGHACPEQQLWHVHSVTASRFSISKSQLWDDYKQNNKASIFHMSFTSYTTHTITVTHILAKDLLPVIPRKECFC